MQLILTEFLDLKGKVILLVSFVFVSAMINFAYSWCVVM